MLTRELAAEVVKETMERVNGNVNMMDLTGTIIASGDPERIGRFHEAALACIRHNKELSVTTEQARLYRGVQAGINLPVHYEGRAVGAIGITGDPETVKPLGQLVRMATELMLRQHHAKLQHEWQRMSVDLLAGQLLQHNPDDALVHELAHSVGFSLQPPFLAAVASYDVQVGRSTGETTLQQALRLFEGRSALLVSGYRPLRMLIVCSEAEPESFSRTLSALSALLAKETMRHRIGVGCPADDISGIRISCSEADAALRLGERRPEARSGEHIVRFESIEAELLIQDTPDEHKLRLLAKWAPHWNGKLEETLAGLFDCDLHIGRTAAKLGIHRNTLLYRIEQIRLTTGYDPLRFRDALLLQAVLWLKRTTTS